MTREEREQRAVAEHRCPTCDIIAGFRCVKQSGSFRNQRTKHPHPARVALVARPAAAQAQLTASGDRSPTPDGNGPDLDTASLTPSWVTRVPYGDPDAAPATMLAADRKTVLNRYRVEAVIYAPTEAKARGRLAAANLYLDHARVVP